MEARTTRTILLNLTHTTFFSWRRLTAVHKNPHHSRDPVEPSVFPVLACFAAQPLDEKVEKSITSSNPSTHNRNAPGTQGETEPERIRNFSARAGVRTKPLSGYG